MQLSQVTGASTWRIVRRHILPNVMNTVMVLFSLTIGVAIIIEASLSFLGVGVPPPKPAWGLMMAEGRGPLIAGKWWVSVFPGLCIMLLVLATLAIKVGSELQQSLVARGDFEKTPYIGRHGWASIRVDHVEDWAELGELLHHAHAGVASKKKSS